mgnify:FL=1
MVQTFSLGVVEKAKTDSDFRSIGTILAKADADITNVEIRTMTLKALRWLWARRDELKRDYPVK